MNGSYEGKSFFILKTPELRKTRTKMNLNLNKMGMVMCMMMYQGSYGQKLTS